MKIQFMQKNKPTPKQIWRETGKKNIRLINIFISKQPYESPIWTVEYEEAR